MSEFKDFLGNPIALGDTVVLIIPNYRSLAKGRVTRLTPEFVIVEYDNNISRKCTRIKQKGEQLVVVNHDF